jgi:hypothetical protein
MVGFLITLMTVVIGWPQLAGMQPLIGYPQLMMDQWPYMAGAAVAYLVILKIFKRAGFWNVFVGVPIAALTGVYGFALYNAAADESPVRYRIVEIARARETDGSKVGCSVKVVPRGKPKPVWTVPLGCAEFRAMDKDPGALKRLGIRRGKMDVEWIISMDKYEDEVIRRH